MRHLSFFSLILLLSSSAMAAKTNVLLIVADDLNVGMAAYGHALVKTPNLDRLARMGVRFDRAYCNYPVCNASRTSFLSGRLPSTTQVVGNGVDPRVVLGSDFQFLPEYFKAQGYFTAGIGKITHNPQHLQAVRWDVVSDPLHDPAHRVEVKGPELKKLPDEAHPDGITARLVARLMEEHREGPFFIGAGFHRPHSPCIAPQKYFDMYPADQIEVSTATTSPDIPEIAFPPAYDATMTPKQQRNKIQAYYACVTFMDAQLGVLMEVMDRLDLWRNTVVVFLGDNGYHLGEHGGFWGKQSLMDESGRVPLILCAPNLAGGPCKRAVSLVDVYPSLVDLCQVPAPEGLEGHSLVPLMREPNAPWNHAVQSIVVRGEKRDGMLDLGRSVHTDRFSFIQWPDGSQMLYDDQADPKQTRNLAAEADQREIIAELRQRLPADDRMTAQKGIGKGVDRDL